MKPLDVKDFTADLDARARSTETSRTGMVARALAQMLLALAVLAGGYGAYQFLLTSRPAMVQRTAPEQVWNVSVAPVTYATHQPVLSLYGETIAARQVEMRALVGGEVVAVADALREGGMVSAGDMLVEIDDFAYRGALTEARANLREAEARLAQSEAQIALEKSAMGAAEDQLEIARRDLDRAEQLAPNGSVSQQTVDTRRLAVSERGASVEQHRNTIVAQEAAADQQRAQIERITWSVEQAERNVANTVLRAPFDAYVTGIGAQVGRLLSTNDVVATLYGSDRAEVRVSLSESQYGRIAAAEGTLIGRPVEVVWRLGDATHTYSGEIARVGALVDSQSGGIDLYASVDPLSGDAPLRSGTFVEVRLPDRAYDDAARLPETALYGSNSVYVPVEGRLEERTVTLVGRTGTDILVTGALAEGEQVVTSRITEIGEGLRVKVLE